MPALDKTREAIEQALTCLAQSPIAVGDVELQTAFDRDRGHFLLTSVGWGKQKRIYGVIAHVDLIGDKAWIQHDGTQEGLAQLLLDAGVSADNIVLGFRIPEVRKHTGYAVA